MTCVYCGQAFAHLTKLPPREFRNVFSRWMAVLKKNARWFQVNIYHLAPSVDMPKICDGHIKHIQPSQGIDDVIHDIHSTGGNAARTRERRDGMPSSTPLQILPTMPTFPCLAREMAGSIIKVTFVTKYSRRCASVGVRSLLGSLRPYWSAQNSPARKKFSGR